MNGKDDCFYSIWIQKSFTEIITFGRFRKQNNHKNELQIFFNRFNVFMPSWAWNKKKHYFTLCIVCLPFLKKHTIPLVMQSHFFSFYLENLKWILFAKIIHLVFGPQFSSLCLWLFDFPQQMQSIILIQFMNSNDLITGTKFKKLSIYEQRYGNRRKGLRIKWKNKMENNKKITIIEEERMLSTWTEFGIASVMCGVMCFTHMVDSMACFKPQRTHYHA